MDISKLPIQIADPIRQAEKNILKSTPKSYYDLSWPNGIPSLRNMTHKDPLSKVLFTIIKYPNMNWCHIYKNCGLKYFQGDYIQFAHFAGLITNKVPKTYKGSNPGYRITSLGLNVLKQNGLID